MEIRSVQNHEENQNFARGNNIMTLE